MGAGIALKIKAVSGDEERRVVNGDAQEGTNAFELVQEDCHCHRGLYITTPI